jgi:CheY-like chemotaxis protein
MIACIIDDDRIHVFGLKKLLTLNHLSSKILVFPDGKKALEGLAPLLGTNDFPDIIFLDINMPMMDGWEFLEEFALLKSSPSKKTKLYMLSSSIDENDLAKSTLYQELTGYISKPISTDTLLKIMVN